MNQKDEALKLIEHMPETSSTSDIMAELYFKSKVEKGRKDIRENRVLTQEEVEKKMATWAKSTGSELAQKDLEGIGDYIAKDAPLYAIEFVENILHHTRHLPNHPKIGRVVPEFEIEILRELIFHNYRIIYELYEDGIYIVSVSHASMDIKSKAKREKWELP